MFSADEAHAIILAFKWGYLSRDEINELAISKIEEHDGTPPANICELAVSKQDFEVNEILSEMADGSEKWSSLKLFLKTYIQIERLTNSEVSKLAKYIGHQVDWDDDEPWRGLKLLDHEIGDARIGAYGDYDELCQEFRGKISGALKTS